MKMLGLLLVKMYLLIMVFSTIMLPYVHASISSTSTSYHLTYDGIFSQKRTEKEISSSASLALAKTIMNEMTSSIINNEESNVFLTNTQLLEMTCLPKRKIIHSPIVNLNEDDDSRIVGTKCVRDYRTNDFLFESTVSIEKIHDNDNVVIRIDVIIMSEATDNERELLVKTIPIIEKIISDNNDGKDNDIVAYWNIRERIMPSSSQVSINQEENTNTSSVERVVPKLRSDIYQRILGNESLRTKKLLFSSQTHYQGNQSTSLVDIWEYQTMISEQIYRDMYIQSKLRGSTSETAIAHSEAFVHPALTAHAFPKRIAIISDMPGAYVKEVLKYKSVTNITIVGASREVIHTASSYLPHINDCTMIENVSDKCMDDVRLEILDDEIYSWAERLVDECVDLDLEEFCTWGNNKYESCAPYPAYDVVLVDVSSPYHVKTLLSVDFFQKIIGFTTSDSIIVINSEASPSVDGDIEYANTERFIASVVEYCEQNDLWFPLMVYDEVNKNMI